MADEIEKTVEEQGKTQETAEINTATEQGKTFTQAEVDKIISERLKREREKVPNDDELKAYREWKKSQQSEAERSAEREKEYQALQARAMMLEQENIVIKSGVNPEDVDYVIFKVSKMDGDFSENLKKFLTENEKFTEPKTETVSGTEHKPLKANAKTGVEVEFLRRNPGLKID